MDEAAKKHALRLVPYGLYLAGARHADDSKTVSLVSWFTQASFKPPLVVVGMHKESSAYRAVQETGVLSLNLIGADQEEILKRFFKHVDVDEDAVAGLPYVDGPATGCPILTDLPAALELERRDESDLGDHATVIFEVVEGHVHDKDAKALSHEMAGLHYAG